MPNTLVKYRLFKSSYPNTDTNAGPNAPPGPLKRLRQGN